MNTNYVLTLDGYRDINRIVPGDLVLSHDGQHHRVLSSDVINTRLAKFKCSLTFSDMLIPYNSSIYAVEFNRYRDTLFLLSNQFTNLSIIYAADEEFIEYKKQYAHAKSQPHVFYAGTLAKSMNRLPAWNPNLSIRRRCGHFSAIENKLDITDPDLWYIIGCLLARGYAYLRSSGNYSVCFGSVEGVPIEPFTKKLLKFSKFTIYHEELDNVRHRDRFNISIEDLELREFVVSVLMDNNISSEGAFTCTPVLLHLPKNLQQEVLDGFMQYAGSTERETHWVLNNANAVDLLNITQLIMNVKESSCSICVKTPKSVNHSASFKLDFITDLQRVNTEFNLNNTYFRAVRNVESLVHGQYRILTVEGAHSYVLNNLIVGDSYYIR